MKEASFKLLDIAREMAFRWVRGKQKEK